MIKATDKKIGKYLTCELEEKSYGGWMDIEGEIKARGRIIFSLEDKKIKTTILDKNFYLKKSFAETKEEAEDYWKWIVDTEFTAHFYDVMTGKEFYNDVDCGGFIDYDGCIAQIWVDGYISNLGLYHRGICQGAFKVSGKDWLKICEEHEVYVNWANK